MDSKKIKILVVDDEREILLLLKKLLEKNGYLVEIASEGEEAIAKVASSPFHIVLTDLNMPGMGGLELLAKLKENYPKITVIFMTGFGTVRAAVQAIKEGAYDFIEKPFNPKELLKLLHNCVERQKSWEEISSLSIENREDYRFNNIIGYSPQMHKLYDEIKTVAKTDVSILILGENGTGKELVADAIHFESARNKKPIIKVNCGALAESIIESELFGHERGAFTGAVSRKKGNIEVAAGGTLFLDEIVELTAAAQVKLLRILETGEFQRVGGVETLKADFRLISATNVNLEEAVLKKGFREDLYYRVNTVILEIPPLRERRADIPLLTDYLLKRTSKKMKKKIDRITNDAMSIFMKYDWPGNVRELSNTIERCAAFCRGREIRALDIPQRIAEKFNARGDLAGAGGKDLAEVEASYILTALEENQWNLKRAAQSLNIARGTLYSKMKKYNISRPTREMS